MKRLALVVFVIFIVAVGDAWRRVEAQASGVRAYRQAHEAEIVSEFVELLSLPNVVLTPHVGSATRETREAMTRVAVENVLAVAAGRRPVTPVWVD